METKVCNKCKLELPATIEYFHKFIRTKDGLHYTCKKCINEKERNRWKIKQLSKPKFIFKYQKEYKECSTCKNIYPNNIEFFNLISSKMKLKLGKVNTYTYLSSRCKKCGKEESKKWRISNPDKVKERNKNKDKSQYPIYAHRSYLKRKKEGKIKEWGIINKDKIRLYSRTLTEKLADCYVRSSIKDVLKLPSQSNIPEYIVEAKKAQLKLHRITKNYGK